MTGVSFTPNLTCFYLHTAGSWSPDQNDRNPYIQVELPQIEPIYGVIMQGSPLFDQYVSSYDIMYGDDGLVFSTVDGPDGKPKVCFEILLIVMKSLVKPTEI